MSRRAAQQEARAHQNRWWTLAVLCLSVLLVAIDNTIVNVALPTLVTELDATTSQLQWIVDAYSMVFAGLLLVAGNIGDRAGRRRILQVGLVLFAIASLFATWSDSADSLIGARAVMGIAAALVYPSTLATLPQVFKDRGERAIAIGVWAGVSGLAIALGPVAGGLLLRHFWWGSIFLVNIPIIIFAFVAGALLVPESRDPRPGRFDVVGAVSSTLTIGVLVWTIIEAPSTAGAAAPASSASVSRVCSRCCSSSGSYATRTRCWKSGSLPTPASALVPPRPRWPSSASSASSS